MGSRSTATTCSAGSASPRSSRAASTRPSTGPIRSSARRAPPSRPRIVALTTLGVVRARRGDPDPWSPLDEAYDLAVPSGEARRIAPPSAGRAEAAWLEGRESDIAELTDRVSLAVARRDGGIVGALGAWRRRAGLPVEVLDGVDEHHALELRGEFAAAAARWAETGCPTRPPSHSQTQATRRHNARPSTRCNASEPPRRRRACAAPACAGCRGGRAARRARARRT